MTASSQPNPLPAATTTVQTAVPATGSNASVDKEAIVKCIGLAKVYRDFWLRNRVWAVDGVDLEVYPGEVFGLLGPNGSGKSTTIKMILGLLYPTAGRISVFGKRPEDVSTKKLIGYLPEESNLYPFLNARETLEYYAQLFGQDRRRRQRRIDMLLEMVGLSAVQRRPVGHYSKGMQRRIGLAGALINDPQLLILDEPTNGLDPVGTRQIKDLILELSGRRKTILLCSHLLADVEDVCGRVAIMFGGKICATGSVNDLLVRQDAATIQVSQLDDETIQKVESLLQTCGKHIEKIERPRQRLESFFLDIVHQAQAQQRATSGAQIGGEIAEFLKEPEDRHVSDIPTDSPPPPLGKPESLTRDSSINDFVAIPVSPQARSQGETEREITVVPTPTEVLPPEAEDSSVIDRLVSTTNTSPPLDAHVQESQGDPPSESPESLTRALANNGPFLSPEGAPGSGGAGEAPDHSSDDSQAMGRPADTEPFSDSSPLRPAATDQGVEEPDEGFLNAIEDVQPFDPESEGAKPE